MKHLFLFSLCVLAVVGFSANPFSNLTRDEIQFKTWVVLAAGSNNWTNYRHQADVCHAYHAIHDLGVPEDHIIVMMYDDIAFNSQNTLFPGQIFNSGDLSVDVYAGVPHDYTGDLVTADNFLSILQGKQMTVGSRKSLKSGPDDNVFVFYDDHGGYDALAFPDRVINSSEIENTLGIMKKNNMYKNLVIYVEACFSGSLFYKISLPDNVYVTTAAPIRASSSGGCYHALLDSAVCDLYSYAWITDIEKGHGSDYTFSQQFDFIQTALKQSSQGCRYGGKNIIHKPISEFFEPSFAFSGKRVPLNMKDSISNFDLELEIAERTFRKSPSNENKKRLKTELAIRQAVDKMGVAIVSAAVPDVPYLSTPPCTDCSGGTVCVCLQWCMEESPYEECAFECCNEESCNIDPEEQSEFLRQDSCVSTLSRRFREKCGSVHPYLLKTTLLFMRACKQQHVNISSALDEIDKQCAGFNINVF